MQQHFTANHFSAEDNTPEGGNVFGPGFAITWQRGPLGRGAGRREPNGAFVETVLRAARDRLDYYQRSPFACRENADAILAIGSALASLESRTATREARGVEGTAQV